MTEIAPTTLSIPLDELTLEQLVQLSQRLGREADALQGQRAYLRIKIRQRLDAGERTSTDAHASRPAAE